MSRYAPSANQLARTLMRLRAERDISQAELAQKTKTMSEATIGRIEAGRANPKWSQLCALSEALETPLPQIIERAIRTNDDPPADGRRGTRTLAGRRHRVAAPRGRKSESPAEQPERAHGEDSEL